jgi:signal transduction histidine kinase
MDSSKPETASQNCTPDGLVALSRAATTARLLAGVIHEINNALLVVSGTVELLEGRRDLPEATARPLERLRTQSHRMALAIAQVTAFTQAPLGEVTDMSFRDVVRMAVDLRRFAVTRAGLTMEVAAEGDPCLTRGNPGELQQAVLNLIISAEQALAGTRGHLAVETARTPEWVQVRVADDRPAASESLEQMFEPFVATRSPTDLSGLGLFAARAIAEGHGGTLAVERDGERTALVMRLPAKR